MLPRPKPGDSEDDLLRYQEQFLASGSEPAVRIIRKVDKRKGETESSEGLNEQRNRDVVSIQGFPEEPPPLNSVPPKKSRFKTQNVRFEDEDPEERINCHDKHVTVVLSKIIERDTSAVPVTFPAFTGAAFPKACHRSEVQGQIPSPLGRKSIFAQKMMLQKAKENGMLAKEASQSAMERIPTRASDDVEMKMQIHQHPDPTSGLISGDGLGKPDSASEVKQIQWENEQRLKSMSEVEILEEQRKLISQLDPRLVAFVKSKISSASLTNTDLEMSRSDKQSSENEEIMELETTAVMEDESSDQDLCPPITVDELPVKPKEGWVHMDKLEPEKLEWLRDLPPSRKKGTKKAMQARFDFSGSLIPPTADLPTHLGLHHHGEEPELAGYSLQELFHLSRSKVTQQRTLAFNTLARVLHKVHLGELASMVKGRIISTLLDAGLLFLLRFALDDNVEVVIAGAVRALWALLVVPNDEECLDRTFSWLHGMFTFPLLPMEESDDEEEDEVDEDGKKETVEEKEARKQDHEVAQADIIKGLLKMKLLPRLRYILEVVRPGPRVVQDVLEILIRICRHSAAAASQVLDCPRLMGTIISEFLPCSWTSPSMSGHRPTLERPHGLPVAAAMKLIRVLASTGRHACARLLNNYKIRARLLRFIAVEPEDLLLEACEAKKLSLEALRMWCVAAGYGQACDLYRDMYPVLIRMLQSIPQLMSKETSLEPFSNLTLQRTETLLLLLTTVTQTAGSTEELKANQMGDSESALPPPPPLDWSQVAGLQPFIKASLKTCLRWLAEPSHWENVHMLAAAHLVYLGSFYSQLYVQSTFCPVDTLQEIEALTSEVLLPLTGHQTVLNMIDHLRQFSALCAPTSCAASREIIHGLPGFGCSEGINVGNLSDAKSPFPFLMGLFYVLDSITNVHKGLACKFFNVLVAPRLLDYLCSSCSALPSFSLSSAWLFRHEYHLQYLLLKLAFKQMPLKTEVSQQITVYHKIAMAMLPRLLPGSEYQAHELLSTMIFNPSFIPEGRCGGPEAVDLSQLLRLRDGDQCSLFTESTTGTLLREAYANLASLRGCYLTHLAHLEPSVLRSRDIYLGHTPFVCSQMLSELTGPVVPSDWAFLPLVCLYEQTTKEESSGRTVESVSVTSTEAVTHCLQWLLILETWHEDALKSVPPAAKFCRLACIFLSGSDLFRERPVQRFLWALLLALCRPTQLNALDLTVPPPGLASFHDFYSSLLVQFEAVSFGDPLFGCFLLVPLQRHYSTELKLAVFGEHIGLLRSLGVSLAQLPIPLERFTSPPEDSLPLLRSYFRALVTGSLRLAWCPVLYAVAVAHVNAFIFSQDTKNEEIDMERKSLLRKTYFLTDEVLKNHLLLFKMPRADIKLGFEMFEKLPPIRDKRLNAVLRKENGTD
ncbi:RNA polymerase II-associated protein 1 [Polypterus senegalus]|uniref:RNA polymerase II-associated protein 1 n=1 Tax=Polypterus senegalus TaxID=55291 RepID=UPI001963117D|nr:RNA polymerase II-associated protein 1 [Polypterus senegalus]